MFLLWLVDTDGRKQRVQPNLVKSPSLLVDELQSVHEYDENAGHQTDIVATKRLNKLVTTWSTSIKDIA